MAQTTALGSTAFNPAMDYAVRALWSNPENDKQFQVKIWRVTPDIGAINSFGYMGSHRKTPLVNKRFHIYSVAGTHPGMWNLGARFKTANPFNVWTNASVISKRRGVQLDFYTGLGKQFPRTKTWVMFTQDGLVLIAFEQLKSFPITVNDDMHFRCYSTDLDITKSTEAMDDKGNPYVMESMSYENTTEYGRFKLRYSAVKARAGFTGVFVNGIYRKQFPEVSELAVGDMVEFWHDPTVERVLYYNYADLKDYYSDLDKQRKFILHPPKDGDFQIRWFDDNDYYFVDGNGNGVYYHRNAESACRQLTHADVAISVSQLKGHMEALASLRDISTARIMVLQRKTNWTLQLPWEHQRIHHLYRLSDANIMKAFTGERSVMPEWAAPALESGPVMSFMRSQWGEITAESVNLALGYNAETLAISATPISAAYDADTKGVLIPPTYQETSTVWEYDAEGKLLGYYWRTGSTHLIPKYPTCAKLEFTYGKPARALNYLITNQNVTLPTKGEFHVYSSAYSFVNAKITGPLTLRTGTDFYHLEGNQLVWDKLDKVNQRAIVVYDDQFLCHEFQLDHLDHSLCFSIDDLYENVLGNLPLNFAQIDVWLNGNPLIDEVDWLFRERRFFINNQQFLVDGPQTITVRCVGQHADMTKPKQELELGYVEGGVIGNQARYNIREDRATRIVVGGKLMLLSELKTAETDTPDTYDNPLNGLPYMVKHTYTPVKNVKDFDFHYLYQRSRDTDKRVIDYLTQYAEKPTISVDYNMPEKWLLYSPFMNVVANAINNGVLVVPEKPADEEFYSNQVVSDLVEIYKWWLPYDPIVLKYDQRYFGILPYANQETLVVKSNEFTFLKQVNDLYLHGVLSIEGYFEVSHNV